MIVYYIGLWNDVTKKSQKSNFENDITPKMLLLFSLAALLTTSEDAINIIMTLSSEYTVTPWLILYLVRINSMSQESCESISRTTLLYTHWVMGIHLLSETTDGYADFLLIFSDQLKSQDYGHVIG